MQKAQGVGVSGISPLVTQHTEIDSEITPKQVPSQSPRAQLREGAPNAFLPGSSSVTVENPGATRAEHSQMSTSQPVTVKSKMEQGIPDITVNDNNRSIFSTTSTTSQSGGSLPVIETGLVSNPKLEESLKTFNLGTVALHEGCVRFETDTLAECVPSHVCVKDGTLHMSEEFAKSLQCLAGTSPKKLFARLCEDIRVFTETSGKTEGAALKKFIRYEVYKEIPGHKQNLEEAKQNEKLAQNILEKYGIISPNKEDSAKQIRKAFSEEVRLHFEKNPLPKEYIEQFRKETRPKVEEEIRNRSHPPKVKLTYQDSLEIPKLINKKLEEDHMPLLYRGLHDKGSVQSQTMAALDDLEQRVQTYEKAVVVVAQELSGHCMCRCVYTAPIPALVRMDELFEPGNVNDRTEMGDRLKAKPLEATIHVFETTGRDTKKNECTSFQIAHPKGIGQEELAKVVEGYTGKGEVHLVAYDPATHVLANVQVPVMKEATQIAIELPSGVIPKNPQSAEKEALVPSQFGFVLSLGTGPEKMFPFPIEQEDAGTFRRTPNSQRVIEVSAPRKDALSATLQIKGGGVPAYGFDHNDPKGLTGGEYFDLVGDTQLSEFHDFASQFKLQSDITQLGNACATGASIGRPSSDDKVGRHGGLSFRVDCAGGLRFPDLVRAPEVRSSLKASALSSDLLEFATEIGVGADLRRAIDTAIGNYAAANLLGMVYEDSNLDNFTDLGARGSFPDAGTIRAAIQADFDHGNSTFFDTINRISSISLPTGATAAGLHRLAMASHLRSLGDPTNTGIPESLREAFMDAAAGLEDIKMSDNDAQKKIRELAWTLTGKTEGSNLAQDFFRQSPVAYAEHLAKTLTEVGLAKKV
jgi:hypothetical protein